MRGLFWISLQLAALWPAVHWYLSRTRHASDSRVELVALIAAGALLVLRARRVSATPDLRVPALWTVIAGVAWVALPPLFATWIAIAAVIATASRLWLNRSFDPHVFGLASLSLPVLPLFQYHLSYPLRAVVAEASAILLRFAGVATAREGACLSFGDRLIWVDAPCSGLRMMWSAVFLALGLTALFECRGRRTAMWVTLAIGLVVGANILRTSALFFIESGQVAAPGWFHEGVGVVLYAAVALTLFLLIRPEGRSTCSVAASS